MIFTLCFILANSVTAYQWQELPSPEIRTHAHGVVYDPINDLFFIMGGDSSDFEDFDFMDICLEFDPKTNTWNTKEPMPTRRGRHCAAYRNGFIHVLCGMNESGTKITTHAVYNISSDSWDTAAPSPFRVARPAVETWRDSLVYLIGGYDVSHVARDDVYFYDATTNSWDSATFMPQGMHCGTAEIKGDSIFIFGGYKSRILLGEINPADPSEINWSWGETLPMANNAAPGLAIKNNKAYMIGGDIDGGINEAWQYDIQNETWTSLPDYPTSRILRGDFAQRRDGPDSLGVIYCFMGDTSVSSGHSPTDECFRLVVAVNDAGMYAINSPVSDTTIESFVQVNGTVKNYGGNTYSFKTYVNIYDPDLLIAFSDSMQVDDLASSDTLNIDFGSFQLTKIGTYTVEMFTYASDDTYPFNDSLTTTFNSADSSGYFWEEIPSPGIRNLEHAAVYDPINDLFFIIGGDSTGFETNMDVCLSFDPETNTWDTKTPMPTKRARHCADYRNGFIHVLCGKDNYGNNITTHEVYDIELNSWSTKAAAPLSVNAPNCVAWRDSLIYLMGGYDVYHNARSEVYLYNATTNTWDAATSLPRPFFAGGAKIKGDSIFIIGGADGSSIYSNILIGEINPDDPTEIDWSWGTSLPMAYNGANGLAIKDNKAYMIGGNFDDGTNEVWEYNIPDETWDSLPDYPTSIINKFGFAERRDGPDSSGVVYCFMGDTSITSARLPTNECYRLIRIPFSSGIGEDIITEKNSISLNSTISFADDVAINCNILERCDLKIDMYDISGRKVFSSLERNLSPGRHQFSIKEDFKNGIYFIKIEAGSTAAFEKIILIR